MEAIKFPSKSSYVKTRKRLTKESKGDSIDIYQQEAKLMLERAEQCFNPSETSSSITNPKYFIAIDLETYELDHSATTEIGICLAGPAEGNDSDSKIIILDTLHFIIMEYAHLKNGRFVCDNQGNFKFGKSQKIPLKMAAEKVNELFLQYQPALVAHDIEGDMKVEKEKRVLAPIICYLFIDLFIDYIFLFIYHIVKKQRLYLTILYLFTCFIF